MKNILIIARNALIFITCLYPVFAFGGAATLSQRPAVNAFINSMVKNYQFNGPLLADLFNQVQIKSSIIDRMNQPQEASSWNRYRTFFITPVRIKGGAAFWNQHSQTLAYAQKQYGVPANMIVAILGVETQYGQIMGKYRVIDALSTLAFNYPPRSAYFKKELAEFLLLTREQHLDPLKIYGSYAGAMGAAQFMPSSYRAFALSFKGNNKVDLWNNPNDAIVSVANYFKNHGWQPGQPIATPALFKNDLYKTLINNKLQPTYTLQRLAAAGIHPRIPVKNTLKANLIQLKNPGQNEYWLGFNNFYVITAYNTSQNYAMAVYQLAQQIQQKYNPTRAS